MSKIKILLALIILIGLTTFSCSKMRVGLMDYISYGNFYVNWFRADCPELKDQFNELNPFFEKCNFSTTNSGVIFSIDGEVTCVNAANEFNKLVTKARKCARRNK